MGLPDALVFSIRRDKSHLLWLAFDQAGVWRYDEKSFLNYTSAKSRDRLVAKSVTAIYRDSQGAHWFGTPGSVTRFDGQVWSSLDTRDGLIGNQVTGICESPRGVFWLATGSGVTRYEPRKMELAAPKLSVQIDQEYTDLAAVPSVLQGRLVTFKANAIDTKTRPEVRRYRWRIVEGRATAAQVVADGTASVGRDALRRVPDISLARFLNRERTMGNPERIGDSIAPSSEGLTHQGDFRDAEHRVPASLRGYTLTEASGTPALPNSSSSASLRSLRSLRLNQEKGITAESAESAEKDENSARAFLPPRFFAAAFLSQEARFTTVSPAERQSSRDGAILAAATPELDGSSSPSKSGASTAW